MGSREMFSVASERFGSEMLSPSGCNPALTVPRSIDTSPGPNILAVVKRELELLQSKVSSEISQLRESTVTSIDMSNNMRQVSLQRIEEKLAERDEVQTKLDKRVCEASGTLRGLSGEMENQIKWADTVEARLWEFRHQIEEEFHQKCSDLDLQHKELHTKLLTVTMANEDLQSKFGQSSGRLEGVLQGHTQNIDVLAQAVADQQERLQSVEDTATKKLTGFLAHAKEYAKVSCSQDEHADAAVDARLRDAEQKLADHAQKVDRLHNCAHGERGWEDRLNEHEARLATMRVKLEGWEQHYTSFDELIKQTWGSQMDKSQKQAQEHSQKLVDMEGMHEALLRRAEDQQATIDQLRMQVESEGQRVFEVNDPEEEVVAQVHAHSAEAAGAPRRQAPPAVQSEGLHEGLADCQRQLRHLQAQLQHLWWRPALGTPPGADPGLHRLQAQDPEHSQHSAKLAVIEEAVKTCYRDLSCSNSFFSQAIEALAEEFAELAGRLGVQANDAVGNTSHGLKQTAPDHRLSTLGPAVPGLPFQRLHGDQKLWGRTNFSSTTPNRTPIARTGS